MQQAGERMVQDPVFQQEGISAMGDVMADWQRLASESSAQQQMAQGMQQAGMHPLMIEQFQQMLRHPQMQQMMQLGVAQMQNLSNNPSAMQQMMSGMQQMMSNPQVQPMMARMQQAMGNPETMARMQQAIGRMMGGQGFH